MTTLRRIFTGTALLALAISTASATTIIELGTEQSFGNIPTFVAPGTNSTSAQQYSVASANAAIAATCPAGYSCGTANLYEIDLSLTANLSATVTVANTSGGTSYIGPIGYTSPGSPGTDNGTFGHPTSGTDVAEVATILVNDALNSSEIVVVPTFSIASTNEFKTKGTGAGCSGAAIATAFVNCLAIPTGGKTFSGTGTDTEGASYSSTDANWATESSTYTGAGTVPFSLVLTGSTDTGAIPAGTTIPTNIAAVSALSDGLVVTYDYSYTATLIPPPPSTPEPTTFVLMGGALVGFGLICKKLRKSS